jgi:Uma2 family endonuclease
MVTERQADQWPPGYAPPRQVSVEEYLRLEAAAEERHEYWHGWMYPRMYPPGSHWAMAGGTLVHSRLIVRLTAALDAHLGDGPCAVYQGDVRLYVNADDYFYPDAFVSCAEPADSTATDLHDAIFIGEVLSPSTGEFDRGDKLDAYAALPGLREYVLLDTRRVKAIVHRREPGGPWVRFVALEGADLELETLGLRLPLAQLYRGIPLAPLVDEDTAP